jgi:serine protease Do
MTKLLKLARPISIFAILAFLGTPFLPSLATAAELHLGQEPPPVTLSANSAALALQKAFIDVAAAVSPGVVNISSEWTENIRGLDNFGGMDDFFNFWFYGPHGQRSPQRVFKQKQRSLGSGFLITSDGYILTNAHVIGKAEKVTVTMEDGTTYPGKIIGKDDKVDIGIIKIEGKNFPHLVLGDSDALQVGEWAIAVGNPFALDHTVTTGVISAKGRSVEISQDQGAQSYIQTDASINPGNSGGPLCNIQGQVVGINSAIYSQSGGSVGIGFAIPVNIARKAAEDLVNNGKIIRAGLGAMVQTLDPKMAKSFGLASPEGALISNINPGSAAEKAGLKPGDIVTAVDGAKVHDSADLVAKLYTFQPGQTVQMTILRGGTESTVPVTLQKLDEAYLNKADKGEPNEGNGPSGQGENDNLGLTYQDQTPEIKSQLPTNAPRGPVVTQVDQQSPAAQAGLQPGDIIRKVGNTDIVSANQLTVVLKKSDLKTGVRLFVWRDGETLYSFLQSGDE